MVGREMVRRGGERDGVERRGDETRLPSAPGAGTVRRGLRAIYSTAQAHAQKKRKKKEKDRPTDRQTERRREQKKGQKERRKKEKKEKKEKIRSARGLPYRT